MSKFSYQTDVQINAPIEKVYRYLADFPQHVEWNHQPQAMIALTGEEITVGSRYRTEESSPSNLPFLRKIMTVVMAL